LRICDTFFFEVELNPCMTLAVLWWLPCPSNAQLSLDELAATTMGIQQPRASLDAEIKACSGHASLQVGASAGSELSS
jgi:hypothetical protein